MDTATISSQSRSRTPTVVVAEQQQLPNDRSDRESINSEFEREAYGPLPGEKPVDSFEVIMDLHDSDNPKTWSRSYRWYITMFSATLVMNATFASSAPTGIIPALVEHFHFSEEVATLTISIFVAGYCVGPLLWGPLSEQIGRKPVFVLAFAVSTAFQVGAALAPNTAALLVFRFLSGTFAAAPLANSGAVVADIWDVDTRGKALALFTLAPIAGPAIAPVVSGFISVAGVSWRWVFWVQTIFAGVCLIWIIVGIPETYVPVLLVRRAQRMRKDTGDDRYWAPLERNSMSFGQRLKHILGRPFVVLFREPMLIAITLYMSFVYGVIYLLFEAYPIVFTIGHGFNEGISGLMFLPLFVGGGIGVTACIVFFQPRYDRAVAQYAPDPVPPEFRLELCTMTAPIYTLSFFWFGWTSFPSLSYWGPLTAGLPIGFSFVIIFSGLFTYVLDVYPFVAASAMSAMTVVRSLFGAGFPLFATQMYDRLNPRWASTLLGCIALVMTPIPFVLQAYGHRLRRKSKYAPGGAAPEPVGEKEQSVVFEGARV